MVLPGVKNNAELAAALEFLEATEDEKDYSQLLSDFGRYVEGECVYCNHCLPCPESIDIGQVNRLLDAAQILLTEQLRATYHALPAKASACTACAVCAQRCPFGVDVIGRMRLAATLLEPVAAADVDVKREVGA
jgi:predicted aldo/keto reductase-like oxidoreductase